MRPTTRREFLNQSAATAGLLALGGLAGAQEATSAPLDMAIARGTEAASKGMPIDQLAAKLTEQALEALGGMKRFVGKGDVVWVKPNIGWDRSPEQAANTNPDVTAALVRMCFDAGAKQVKVGDYTCSDPQRSYANSGIEAAAKKAGAEIIQIDPNRFREAEIGGDRLKTTPVYPEIVDCDLVISVPIVKHHGSTKVSLCMKNYMGVVGNRRIFHQDLPSCIRDITAYMKPRLSVLDGIRMLTAHGPTGGDLADVKRGDTVAAGVDIVALDALGAEMLGMDPQRIGTITAGAEAGLGVVDYKTLNLKEFQAA